MAAAFNVELDLPRAPEAAAMARAAVRRVLADEVDAQSASDLALVLSELVSNVVEHGEGAIRMRLRLVDGTLTGEAIDQGHGFEREVREAGIDRVGGRGLFIVDTVSSRWPAD